jgi:hypothetical protein
MNGEIITGYLVVSQDEFEQLLERIEPQFVPALVQVSSAAAGYIPPYLEYLLDVAQRFDLTAEYRFARESMADWIQENPPPGMKKITISRALISLAFSATLIMRAAGRPATSGSGVRQIPGSLTMESVIRSLHAGADQLSSV